MYWLKHNYSSGEITEYSAEQYLNHLRAGIEHFQELSFHTIAGFGANAAMMHYQASQEKPVVLREGSLFWWIPEDNIWRGRQILLEPLLWERFRRNRKTLYSYFKRYD